jgi:hypothetical protein
VLTVIASHFEEQRDIVRKMVIGIVLTYTVHLRLPKILYGIRYWDYAYFSPPFGDPGYVSSESQVFSRVF